MNIEENNMLEQKFLHHAGWFMLKFIVLFSVFEYLYFQIPDTYLRDVIFQRGLVSPCVELINYLKPNEHVLSVHSSMTSALTSLEIVRGCDGAGTIFLLVAAIFAFTTSYKTKLIGLIAGTTLLVVINHLRIIGLYFVSAYKNEWFPIIHSYIAPTFIIVVGCIFFAAWSNYAANKVTS